MVGAVREVLEHKDQAVPLEAPLGQPPVSADELDIVEIIMELEERLEIEIPDEELDRIAGTSETGELPKRITPRMLVELVRKAKPVKSPRGNRPSLRDGAPGQTGSTVRSSPSVS